MSRLPLLVALVSLVSWLPVQAKESSSAAMSEIHKSPCMKCHKRNGTMQGIHGNSDLTVSCVDCHGEKQGHPRKASDLVVFNAATPAETQVKPCIECHDPQALGTLEWTHNVHSNKVSCSQCHQLHPADDPVMSVTQADRAAMCQQCHQSKQD